MGIKKIASNKKAYHEYHIEETFEAGIVLMGTEVKSIRAGKVNLKESFCRIKNGEVFINNMNIAEYDFGNRENHEPTRVRKLLLHHTEIDKLIRLTEQKGLAMVPTKIYFKNNYIKLEIGVGRGKKLHDKRQTLKDKEATREMAKALKASFR
jgi:SsrA-binding protein